MRWQVTNESQAHFDNMVTGLGFLIKLSLKGLAFSPLIIISVILVGLVHPFLPFSATAIVCIGLLSYGQYLVVFYCKGYVLPWRISAPERWHVWMIALTAYTCLLPTFLVGRWLFEMRMSQLIALGLTAAYGVFVFRHYRFMDDWAPATALRIYRLGYKHGLKKLSKDS
jgi:hypothetical protein